MRRLQEYDLDINLVQTQMVTVFADEQPKQYMHKRNKRSSSAGSMKLKCIMLSETPPPLCMENIGTQTFVSTLSMAPCPLTSLCGRRGHSNWKLYLTSWCMECFIETTQWCFAKFPRCIGFKKGVTWSPWRTNWGSLRRKHNNAQGHVGRLLLAYII